MINIYNLEKSYGNKKLFSNFNLDIEQGDRIAILGPSGVGKTTLVSILAGIVPPDSGEIKSLNIIKPSIIFQDNLLLENATIYENIYIVNKNLSEADVKFYCLEMGLGDLVNTKVKKLSGGMKRRVTIMRGIVFESSIVIMDEGIREVDEISREKIIFFINKYIKNRPLLFVTHNREDIVDLKANKIVEMGG